MSGTLAIARRELQGLFLQPLAWVLLALALLLQGLLLSTMLVASGGDLTATLEFALGGGAVFWILLAVLAPLLTMRSIAEEARSGLLEYLLTAPVTDAAVVVGKAAAATAFFALLWAAVPLYGLAAHALGAAPDWPRVLVAYGGSVVLSALFCAVGLFASALSATPALAAFVAFSVELLLLVVPRLDGWFARWFPRDAVRAVLARVDVAYHYQASFLVGVVDSLHLVFFLAWTGAFLFLAIRLVESRRWR